MKTKTVYAIYYDNGEIYEDHWSGILRAEGIFEKNESAQQRVDEFTKLSQERIKYEDEKGYVNFPFKQEHYEVIPITYYYE